MKEPVELRFGSISPAEAERHVLRVRFAEVLQSQSALSGDDDEALHAFRLACKRVRFALERIEGQQPHLTRAAALLNRLTDELGGVHDCARLVELAEESKAPAAAARARRDRDAYVSRARRLWHEAFRSNGEFTVLAQYAGYSRSFS